MESSLIFELNKTLAKRLDRVSERIGTDLNQAIHESINRGCDAILSENVTAREIKPDLWTALNKITEGLAQ